MHSRIAALIALILSAVLVGSFAPSASAVTGAQATNIATGVSADNCPHHRLSKCLRRRVLLVTGVGAGRWDAIIETWESTLADLSNDWRNARWYDRLSFRIQSNGSITNAHWL